MVGLQVRNLADAPMQLRAAFTLGDLAKGALINGATMTFTFKPAPDFITSALLRLRRDVLLNNFTLTKHCSMRMEQRAIDLPRIIECIREGSIGVGRRVENWIGGCFYYKGLVTYVYAPFGDFNAFPKIVTTFLATEDYFPQLDELIDTPRVETVEHVRVVKEVKEVVRNLDSLSVKELEAVLAQKKKEALADLQAKRDALQAQIAAAKASLDRLFSQLSATDLELEETCHE
jgi:uncharacterized protein YbjQ (UPF0145 family)